MTIIKTVALAGANGSVGKPMLEELIHQGYTVTVLARSESTSTYPSTVKTVKVDFGNKSQLVSALRNQDAFISTIGSEGGQDAILLSESVIEAGVKRFIPSEFGSDKTNAEVCKLPFYAPKLAAQTRLEELTASSDCQTTWTHVYCNAFVDYCLRVPLIADLKQKKITLWDGGDVKYTATPTKAVAKATVNILKNLEATKNRAVKISSITLTQKRVLLAAQKALGSEGWTVTDKTTESAVKESYAALKAEPNNVMVWIMGFLSFAIFAQEAGGNFSNSPDNKLLETPQMDEDELVEIIRQNA